MKKKFSAVAALPNILSVTANLLTPHELPLTQFVNPLMGTAPCGHCGYGWEAENAFSGAVCPRAMILHDLSEKTILPAGLVSHLEKSTNERKERLNRGAVTGKQRDLFMCQRIID